MTSPGGHVADIHVDVHPEATRFKEELKRALANLDDVDVVVAPDTTGFAAKLRARLGTLPTFSVTVDPDVAGFAVKLRAKLGTLAPVKVTVTPDTSGFAAKLRSELAKLPAVSVKVDPNMAGFAAKVRAAVAAIPTANIRVDVDDKAALAKLGVVAAAVKALSGVNVRIGVTATVTGLKDVRAMATAVSRLKALATGPINIDVNATTTGPLAEINRLARAVRDLRATATGPIIVDVDVMALGPLADIVALNRAIRSLSRNSFIPVNIHVMINPPGAMAHLIALHGIISRFRGLNARSSVSVGTGNSRGAIQALIAAAIAIGPAIIPVAAAAAAAIGAIGPAALVAGAGIGVGLLAFAGVSDAVKAMGAAQSGAAKTGATLANQQKQVAAANDQVRSAAAGVESAERNLAAAQRDGLRAQQDINQARRDAADAYEDLNSQAANNALQIRQANLSIADTEKALAAVQGLDVNDRKRVDAQLAYDEAKQQLADLTTRHERLGEEQKEAARVGVEGSEQVRSAQERAADAQERIRDAEQALTEARRQSVAAQRDLTAAMVTTGATGGGAVDTLAQKMAALSPAGRSFATFLHGLKDEFKTIKGAAEAGLFPGLQAGIEAMLPIFPKIALFVGRVAEAMGTLFRSAGQALASPFWVDFFDYMGRTAGPMFEAIGGIIGGLARGFASLLVAFTPFSTLFTQGMAGMAQAFADWAAKLVTSNGFNAFIEYVKVEGPKVLDLLGGLVGTLIKLGIAFAPLGSLILDGLVFIFEFLARQSPGTLVAIAASIGAIGLAFAVLVGGPVTLVVASITAIAAAAVYAYTRIDWVRSALDGFLRVTAALFAGIKAGVTTFVEAFTKGGDDITKKGFLGVVQVQAQRLRDTFDYVKAGVVSFLDAFKKGGDEVQQGGFAAYMANIGMVARNVFDWLKTVGIPALQDFATWIGPKLQVAAQIAWAVLETFFAVLNKVFGFLWDNRAVIGAVVNGWVDYVKFAFMMIGFYWEQVLKPIFAAIVWWVQNFMGPVFMWFLHNVIQPVWTLVQVAISVAWGLIQIVFGLIQVGVRALAAVFSWLYENVIRPVWEKAYAAIKGGWDQIRPIFELFGSFIGTNVAPKFSSSVDSLKKIWDGLRDAAKEPIRFLVNDVLNGGLLAAYNAVAKIFHVKPDDVRVDLPKGFAKGGPVWGPGTGTSDSIPAMLSHGEYVIPAGIVKTFGVAFFDQLIGKRKYPFDNAGELGFKDGGIVDWAKSAWDTLTDPVGALKDKALGLLGAMPDAGSQVAQIAVGAGRHLIDGIIADVRGKFLPKVTSITSIGGGYHNEVSQTAYKTAQSLGAASKVILSIMEAGIVESGMRNLNYGDRDSVGFLQQRPSQGWPDPMNVATASRSYLLRAIPKDKLHPNYSAGQIAQSVQISAFPSRYDQVEPAARSLIGILSGQGVATLTGNASPGFPPWPSGPGAQRGDSGVWRNIVSLIRSTGPVSGSFGNGFRPGDPKWHGSGRAVDWMGYEQDALAAFLAGRNPLELIHRTRARDYAFTRGRNKGTFSAALMQAHRNHVHAAFRHGGYVGGHVGRGWDGASLNVPYLYRDQGGMVPPGLSLVNNSTGKDEWMFNDAQMRELVGATTGRSGDAGGLHIDTFVAQAAQSPWDIARELDWTMRHGG